MKEITNDKLLSLIIGARNDTFMGNFRWRLGTTLNFIAYSLEHMGRLNDVEVVVCDWGSQMPLHQVIRLTPAAHRIVRFVVVPPQIAGSLQKDSPFPIPIVQNVAIRRSRGEYIAQTDSDILFRPMAMERLLMVLDRRLHIGIDTSKALLVCSRRHVPFELSLCQPGIEEIEEYLHRYGAMLPTERLIPGIGTPSALALLHRSLWQAIGGYDEQLIYWGWMEIDLYLRITQQYPWQDLANDGVVLYHMEHYPKNDRTDQPRKANPTQIPVSFQVNTPQWGLADIDLSVCSAKSERERCLSKQNSTQWRLVQLRQMPVEQINALMADQEIAWQVDHVQQLIDAKNAHSSTFAITQRGRYGWGYREALSWYAQQLNPLRYLEIGIGASDASLQVAAQFPPVSIFGVWMPLPGTQRWPLEVPNQLSDLLIKVGHQGYMRHIFALDRHNVRNALKGDFQKLTFELIFVHPSGQSIFQQKGPFALLPLLKPGGAIVWPHNQQDNSIQAWQHQSHQIGIDLLVGAQTVMLLNSANSCRNFSDTARNQFQTLFKAHRDQAANQKVPVCFAHLPQHNNSAPHHFHQGLVLYSQGDHARALQHFKQAVCLQPHCTEYRISLSRLYMAGFQDPIRALCQCQHVLRLCPQQKETLTMAATIWRALGQSDLADSYLNGQSVF